MHFILVAWLLALFSDCVTARSDSLISSLALRQADPSTGNCNATCAIYKAAEANCTTPHCGCNVPFLRAEGNCLVCRTTTPEDAATVQFLLDAEISQCHSEKINVNFQLDLPPEAAAIVNKFNRDSANLQSAQRAFLALQIMGGHIGLVVVLLFAVFSRKVRRDPTFMNFCITWIFSSIVFSLLLYRGTEGNTVANSLGEVLPDKCLAQAALTEGAQVMTACSTLGLVIQLWLGLRTAIHGDATHGAKQNIWMTYTLIVMPYVLFIVFALSSVFIGMQHVDVKGDSIERAIPTNFYCTVVLLNPYIRAVYGVTLGILLITVVFDVLIMSVLYRHWWAFRHIQTKSAVSLSILLRVMTFSIYRVVVAVAYGSLLKELPQLTTPGAGNSLTLMFSIPIWVDMLQAAVPLVGFLVLGVNEEMVKSFMFWRWFRPSAISTVQSVNTTGSLNSAWNEKAVLEGDAKFVTVPV